MINAYISSNPQGCKTTIKTGDTHINLISQSDQSKRYHRGKRCLEYDTWLYVPLEVGIAVLTGDELIQCLYHSKE